MLQSVKTHSLCNSGGKKIFLKILSAAGKAGGMPHIFQANSFAVLTANNWRTLKMFTMLLSGAL